MTLIGTTAGLLMFDLFIVSVIIIVYTFINFCQALFIFIFAFLEYKLNGKKKPGDLPGFFQVFSIDNYSGLVKSIAARRL